MIDIIEFTDIIQMKITCDMCGNELTTALAECDPMDISDGYTYLKNRFPDWDFEYYDGWYCVGPECVPDWTTNA